MFSQWKPENSREQGFTLVELLVVILIIGVLAAIAIPMFLNQRKAAAESALKSDLMNFGVAVETKALKNKGQFDGSLPADFQGSPGNVFNVMPDETGTTNVAAGTEGVTTIRPGRVSSYSNGAHPTGSVVDGYNRYTYTGASGGTYGGPYWDYKPGTTIPQGTVASGSLMVKTSLDWCFRMNFEQHTAGFPVALLSGEDTCLKANEWKQMKITVTTTRDASMLTLIAYSSHPLNSTFDFKEPVIVLGDTINYDAVNIRAQDKYCIQGYNESDPENIWNYSKVKGGVQKGRC